MGSLIFLLFINDKVNVNNNLHFTLFADDTTKFMQTDFYVNALKQLKLNLKLFLIGLLQISD